MNDEKSISSRSRNHKSILSISLAGILLALAVIFASISKYVPFLHFPNGGSIALAMAPLALASLMLGPVWGVGLGLAFALIDIAFDGAWSWGWQSLILDYFLGFGVCGIAAVFRKPFFKKKAWSMIAGVSLFGLLRFFSSFLSGCILYNNYLEEEGTYFGKGGMLYSFGYNFGYIFPSVILCAILLAVLAKPLFSMLDTHYFASLAPKNLGMDDDSIDDSKDLPILNGILFAGLILLTFTGALGSIPLRWSDASHNSGSIGFFDFYFLGYFAMILGVALFITSLVLLIKNLDNDAFINRKSMFYKIFRTKRNFYIAMTCLSLVPIALGTTAILSYYTYAYDLYHQASSVESLVSLF